MGRASGRLGGDAGPLDGLDEVRYHWGEAYDIAAAAGGFTAKRRDGKGDTLTGRTPEGLLRQIRADYHADPVSRELP